MSVSRVSDQSPATSKGVKPYLIQGTLSQIVFVSSSSSSSSSSWDSGDFFGSESGFFGLMRSLSAWRSSSRLFDVEFRQRLQQ